MRVLAKTAAARWRARLVSRGLQQARGSTSRPRRVRLDAAGFRPFHGCRCFSVIRWQGHPLMRGSRQLRWLRVKNMRWICSTSLFRTRMTAGFSRDFRRDWPRFMPGQLMIRSSSRSARAAASGGRGARCPHRRYFDGYPPRQPA